MIEEADYYGLSGLTDALKGWQSRQMALSAENRDILESENRVRKLLAGACTRSHLGST